VVPVRCTVAIGVFAAFLAVPAYAGAYAGDVKKQCFALPEQKIDTDDPVQVAQPLLAQNECEAIQRHGLQIQLIEIPQDREDPMKLSLGSKEEGGMLYFNIPFSF
jgi:hypothetical protein